MFDKVSQAAEKLATNVSRRAFLGRLGQGALAVTGVVGGMLAFGSVARADRCNCPPGEKCCICGRSFFCQKGGRCPTGCFTG